METSKEELQSTNEELNTVNDELHNRNIELDRLNSDLRNLLSSTNLPVVMVDRELTGDGLQLTGPNALGPLRIRRLTDASAKVLKIEAFDVGRPLRDIRSDIDVPNLDELIVSVIGTLTSRELEVQDKHGHWYALQIRPYRTIDDKIDGAVIVLSDINEAKQASESIRRSKLFMEETLATVREPLVVLQQDLTVVYVNPSFLRTFTLNKDETNGKLLHRVGDEQWNIPKLRELLEEVLSRNASVFDFEIEHDFPKLGRRTMLLNATKIEDGHNEVPLMLLAIEDITERKQVERNVADNALRKAYERLESIVEERTAAVRQLSLKLLSVQDEEHRSIARELHDSLGQDLATIKMDLQRVRKMVSDDQATELVSKLSESLEKCISETRTISHLLHPPLIDELGFVAAAKWYAEGFSERSGIKVNLQLSNTAQRLPRAVELPLFRILQATLSNVHRHAGSSLVDIRFEVTARQARLEVTDYGKGIDPELLKRFEASGAGVGIGLAGMRERLRELGGRLEVESDGAGTLIRAVVPISAAVQVKKSGK